jgi:dolichol-phosphate mannosyltransferase
MLSIIIPIYNEEGNINLLQQRLRDALTDSGMVLEIIFINDGSTDGSIELIHRLSEEFSDIRYIDLSRNFGHQMAVMAGIDACHGDAVVIIDADLQDPPEIIPLMLSQWRDGSEVVYAKRKRRKGESWLKLITARLFYRLLKFLTSIDIPLDTGDFRLIDRKIVNLLKRMPEKNKFLRGQIAWLGFNQTAIEYDREKRHSGETGYGIGRMIKLAIDGITAFSTFPLKMVTIFGFLCSFLAFLVIVYALYAKYMWDDTVPGWASLMVSILFLGGVQMIALGVIGEYLSRVNDNVRGRPTYVIKDSNF